MVKGQRRDDKREAFWREALARQRQSGRNVRQWCAGERLPETAFYFWRRTIAQRDQDAAGANVPVRQCSPRAVRQCSPQAVRRRSPEPMFVPVTVALPGCPELVERGREHPIVIRLRGGRVMRLPVGMESRRVAELVHAIENASALNESKGVAS